MTIDLEYNYKAWYAPVNISIIQNRLGLPSTVKSRVDGYAAITGYLNGCHSPLDTRMRRIPVRRRLVWIDSRCGTHLFCPISFFARIRFAGVFAPFWPLVSIRWCRRIFFVQFMYTRAQQQPPSRKPMDYRERIYCQHLESTRSKIPPKLRLFWWMALKYWTLDFLPDRFWPSWINGPQK